MFYVLYLLLLLTLNQYYYYCIGDHKDDVDIFKNIVPSINRGSLGSVNSRNSLNSLDNQFLDNDIVGRDILSPLGSNSFSNSNEFNSITNRGSNIKSDLVYDFLDDLSQLFPSPRGKKNGNNPSAFWESSEPDALCSF